MTRATQASCPRRSQIYGFETSARFTARSLVSPSTLTVALPAFSSMLTIVAATDFPFIATLTLSPAFHGATEVASVVGLGAGVGEILAAGLGLALFVSVGLVSQAEAASDSSRTARTFLIISVLLSDLSDFAGEWRRNTKRYMLWQNFLIDSFTH